MLVEALADAAAALQGVAGVTRVAVADTRDGSPATRWTASRAADIRRQLARAVVSRGLGLLELRPMRMSLEEVFLHVTTEEPGDQTAPAEATIGMSNVFAIAQKEWNWLRSRRRSRTS